MTTVPDSSEADMAHPGAPSPDSLFLAQGHSVVLSNSRGPETLQELVSELGPRARAANRAEAAAAGDIVGVASRPPDQGVPNTV